jgi:peptidoglycan hydrolase-like protein with peptidoglycan-binding domain
MSTDAPKTKSKLTADQKAWLKKLGTVINSSDGADDQKAAPSKLAAPARGTQPAGQKSQTGDRKELTESLGVPGLGDIPDLAGKVAGPLKCTCMIQNNTEQTFVLDPASRNEIDDDSGKTMGIAHGEYQEFPPTTIKAGDQTAKFVAVNKTQDLIIVEIHTAGAEGFVRYFLDDEKKTTLTLHFNNPRVGKNTTDARIEGPNAGKFESPQAIVGGGNDGKYLYVVDPKGGIKPTPGPGPGPSPGPQPGPAGDVKSSCLITVNNKTNLVLTLADQGHDRGDFMTFPPQTIAAGASAQFVSVETPHGKEQGCKGFVSWEVGSPSAAIWRCEWDNPESEKNTAKAPAEPQSAGFRTLAQIGQDDENVPVVFTISGGGTGPAPQPGPGPQPGPAPGPAPGPEPEFLAPPGSRQPTLRKGDKSPDGWVEYLQQQLNLFLGANTVDVDGNFGQKTFNAVIAFQKKKKLQVDGTVGNQTWAALRQDTPEAPSTDGRAPHTFEQTDTQARWDVQQTDALYAAKIDRLTLTVVSVGEGKIDDFSATVRVTPPNTKAKVVKVKIGAPFSRTKDDQGNLHAVTLLNFKKNFPATDPNAKMEDYLVEAYFDKELGPDLFKGHIVVV